MGTCIKALKSYEAKLKIKKKGVTITISGQSGSGKSTIADAIAKAFHLKHVNVGDIFRSIAKKKKVKLETLSETVGRKIDFEADKKTLELAKKGKVLLNGRLTAWVAGDNADVRIFVDCDINVRAKRVALRDNKTVAQAKKDLIKRDKNDARRYKHVYGFNIADKRIYDLIIDNTKMKFSEAKKKPVQMVKQLLAGMTC
ncbi:MAG: cytidylate kinase family protein [Candidatus Nanoarchaeia archaeon]|nr:cytidylate kinase family protein [Candidatus Nanoarchaeia archaeon]MDD5239562.1 cytidylate kinase family protein [Candidatus Nanoarchaeia archaeon]